MESVYIQAKLIVIASVRIKKEFLIICMVMIAVSGAAKTIAAIKKMKNQSVSASKTTPTHTVAVLKRTKEVVTIALRSSA